MKLSASVAGARTRVDPIKKYPVLCEAPGLQRVLGLPGPKK